MNDVPSSTVPTTDATDERLVFLRREAAEVYLLLDFLSGRADRSLRPTPEEQARSLLDNQNPRQLPDTPLEAERAKIENDLADPTRLVQRTMGISYPLDKGSKTFESDATFLLRARDVLNSRATPATGATIAFTTLVFLHSRRGAAPTTHLSDFARRAYPAFSQAARRLTRFIDLTSWGLAIVLVVALFISGYAAWGKVMLNTMDAVNRDKGAIAKQLDAVRLSARGPISPTDACNAGTGKQAGACNAKAEVDRRHVVVTNLLKNWEWPVSWACSTQPMAKIEDLQNTIDLCGLAGMAILGNYIMPVLYGLLGSIAFILRRHGDRLTSQLLSPRDLPGNHIRLLLGVVIGGCIGLVFSESSASQSTGILGAVATLSTAALAFLAGFGVDAAFKALEALITHIFHIDGPGKPPAQAR